MNTANLLAVADAIEGSTIPDLGFNMLDFSSEPDKRHPDHTGRSCGTVACIGGWACSLARQETPRPATRYTYEVSSIFNTAQDYLGLTESQAERLFFVETTNDESGDEGDDSVSADDDVLMRITPAQAIAVLRHAAATGEIDWARVLDTE